MIIPSQDSIRKIFHSHQNQCALLKCHKKIIDDEGHINGNIFFIESNEEGQARYNQNLSNDGMDDYHNLILLCDNHGWDIEWKERKYTLSRLRDEIILDQETLLENDFELDDEMLNNVVEHFVEYHDPDRLSHIQIENYGEDHKNYYSVGGFWWFKCSRIFIRPSRNLVGGRFEIVDTKRKFENSDKVIFYPKNDLNSKGIEADTKFKSDMSIAGITPKLPIGEYRISIIDDLGNSKLEKKLNFKILGNEIVDGSAKKLTGKNEKKSYRRDKNNSIIGPIALIVVGVVLFLLGLNNFIIYSSPDKIWLPGIAHGFMWIFALFGSLVLVFVGIRGIKHSIEWDRVQNGDVK